MSDLRFACPFCAQRIACDVAYAGSVINCPGCGGAIAVARPDAGTTAEAAGPEPVGLWTEEAWDEHMRKNPGIYSLDGPAALRTTLPALPVLCALPLPALALAGASVPTMWFAMFVGAIISARLTRQAIMPPEATAVQATCGYAAGILYYAVLAFSFLLGGCCWPTRISNI
jgi:hypothetical protein